MTTLTTRLARTALAAPFIWLGYEAAVEPGGRAALAAELGVPSPEVAVRLNGAAMVAGGLGLATGVMARPAAIGLVASLVPTSVAGHPFWKGDPASRKANRIQFLKNVGLVGGLLAVARADGD
jgi:putative oxidoreductase